MLFQQMLFGLANFFSRNITIFHTFATSLQKQKKIMSFFSQKDYKMLHRPVFAAFHFLYILKNIFRNSSSLFFRIFSLHFCNFLKIACHSRFLPPAFCKEKCPEAFLSLRASRSEYLLQMQQHLCNVEVDQQRGGIHNGGESGVKPSRPDPHAAFLPPPAECRR